MTSPRVELFPVFEDATTDQITERRRSNLEVIGLCPELGNQFFRSDHPSDSKSGRAVSLRQTLRDDRLRIQTPETGASLTIPLGSPINLVRQYPASMDIGDRCDRLHDVERVNRSRRVIRIR